MAAATFFVPAWARSTDPITAHFAADRLDRDTLTDMESTVLAALRSAPGGLTTTEIADRTNLSLVSVSPRMRPLIRKGRIRDSGRTRIPDGHRQPSIVWMTT